jgi:GNAT superfamily N-acetyltransferase
MRHATNMPRPLDGQAPDLAGLSVRLARGMDEVGRIESTEDCVFELAGYGVMDRKYRPHARNFGVFSTLGDCVASLRILRYDLPVLEHFTIADPSHNWNELAEAGTFEEVGSVAILPEWQRHPLAPQLYREAYLDAKRRGVLWWGAIMEPRRIAMLNRRFYFTFRKVADARLYMGGKCAPHLMAMSEVEANMSTRAPEMFSWFTRELIPAVANS